MAPHNGLVHLAAYDDIRDTNVELIGSAMDHRVKYASAATEPAWNNGVVGRRAGLFVWRIEDFQVVPVPAADVGVFYDGDSYVVLHSYGVGSKHGDDDDDDDEKPARLGHEIFFWLGAHTSQDEAGTAAYKTVELDEFLRGGAPQESSGGSSAAANAAVATTQHRELQACPSAAFLALFPERLTIRRGGVATGFTHVGETVEERARRQASETGGGPRVRLLLRVFRQPGQGGVVVHEVAPVAGSLDDGDVFVVDAGDTVYVWQGRACSPMEKARAAEVAEELRTPAHTGGVQVVAQTEGRSAVVVRLLEEGEAAAASSATASPSEENNYSAPRPLFRLGRQGLHGDSSSSSSSSSSHDAAPRSGRRRLLWRLSDASGTLSFDLVRDDGTATLDDLDSNDVFLWDDAGRQVWVWEGRGASAGERAQWLRVAQAYVQQQLAAAAAADEDGGYARLAPLAKVRDGYESPAFLQSLETVY